MDPEVVDRQTDWSQGQLPARKYSIVPLAEICLARGSFYLNMSRKLCFRQSPDVLEAFENQGLARGRFGLESRRLKSLELSVAVST